MKPQDLVIVEQRVSKHMSGVEKYKLPLQNIERLIKHYYRHLIKWG